MYIYLFVFARPGIPCLVLMDANYKIITNNGRGQIEADPDGSVSSGHCNTVKLQMFVWELFGDFLPSDKKCQKNIILSNKFKNCN